MSDKKNNLPEQAKVIDVQDTGNGMKKLKVSMGATILFLLVSAADLNAQCPTTPAQVDVNEIGTLLNSGSQVIRARVISGYPDMEVDDSSHSSRSNEETVFPGNDIDYMTGSNTGFIDIELKNEGNTSMCRDTVTIEIVDSSLPVERLDESVDQIAPHTARLQWSTASEINNAGFPIEKSTNGLDWEELAFVESKAEGGNANTVLNYELVDKECNGVTYYKINQIDHDGTYDKGSILSVQCDINEVISVGPNPASEYVNINVQGDTDASYDVKLIAVNGGRSFDGGEVLTNESKQLNFTDDMAAGVYNVMLLPKNGKGKMKSYRIVKVN